MPIAAAVFFRSADTLYGRYWGAEDDYHSLHFEACYHQGIDYCIEQRSLALRARHAGRAQARARLHAGVTWSAHWIADAPLRRAIGAYLVREGAAIDAYASEAEAHAPFKSLPVRSGHAGRHRPRDGSPEPRRIAA